MTEDETRALMAVDARVHAATEALRAARAARAECVGRIRAAIKERSDLQRFGATALVTDQARMESKRHLEAERLHRDGMSLREIGRRFGRSATTITVWLRQLERSRKRSAERPDLGVLSVRAINCLSNEIGHRHWTAKDVAEHCTVESLSRTPNCGRTTLTEIRAWCEAQGHPLRRERP